jgi:cytochrome c553
VRRIVCLFVVVVVAMLSPGAGAQQQAGKDLSWAFPVINGALPAEEPTPKSLPGSSKTYTPAQIDDLMNPPDWFPDEHAPAPPIVQKGHAGALACGSCHLMSGHGHPESAGLTGFTAAYIAQQMADFKSGVRKDAARMNGIAKDLSDEEVRQASEWFAALKPAPWTKVTEAGTVPKTFAGSRPAGQSRLETESSRCRRTRRGPGTATRIPASSPTCRLAASVGARLW